MTTAPRRVSDLLTDSRDLRVYTDARRRGESASLAHYRVKVERACREVLAFEPDGDTIAYSVDLAALVKHTAGPVMNIVNPDGTHPDGTIQLPPETRVRLYVQRDDDTRPTDYECYDDDDVDAWRRDQWEYVFVTANVELRDGTASESSVGGVETGTYWPGSDEADIWHVVPDLISQAYADAMRMTPDVSAIITDPIDLPEGTLE